MFVTCFEISSNLVKLQICGSNGSGAMASQRDQGHFKMTMNWLGKTITGKAPQQQINGPTIAT